MCDSDAFRRVARIESQKIDSIFVANNPKLVKDLTTRTIIVGTSTSVLKPMGGKVDGGFPC